MKRRQKAGFLTAEKLQKHSNEGKGTEKKKELGGRKEEKRKKAMATPLEFVIATLAEKKLLDAKGPFGDYLFKTSGQIYIAVFYLYMLHSNKAIQCQIMATKRRDLDTGGNLSTRRSWYHGRQPGVFLQHDSHCAFRDVLGLQSRTSKREFSG